MATPVVDTPIADQSNSENEAVSLNISGNFSDADGTDSITYSVIGLPDNSGFSINSSTGLFSGQPLAADLSAAPYTVTIRATDASGDFVDVSFTLDTTQAPAAIPPNVIYRQDGNADPNNLGVPVFTNLAAAEASLTPGDILEIQADVAAGTVNISEGLVLTTSGTVNNPNRIQVRSGDTCNLYLVDGFCMAADSVNYWEIHGINFGREGRPATPSGTATNGYSYATEGDNVEHRRTFRLTGTCSHFRFSSCEFRGGSVFDSAESLAQVPFVGFVDCDWNHTKSNDRGNGITAAGDRHIFVRCTGQYNGHDCISSNGIYSAFIDCLISGDYDRYASNQRTRAFNVECSFDGAPGGPIFAQGNVWKKCGDNGEVTAKHVAYRGLFRRNYYLQSVRQAINCSPLRNTAQPSAEVQVLHGTFRENGGIFNSSDLGISNRLGAANVDDGFQHINFQNCIFDEVGNANEGGDTNQQFRCRWTNVGRSDSDGADFANAFRGFECSGCLINMVSGDFYFDFRDGVANISQTLSQAETNYASHVFSNTEAAPTYETVGDWDDDDLATVKAGLTLTSGSNGKGAAEPHATTRSAGTATTSVPVTNVTRFAALRDPNNYNLGYFSDDLPREYVTIGSNSVVEVTAVDYGDGFDGTLTIATAQTFGNADEVWLSDSDGTIWDDPGASQ